MLNTYYPSKPIKTIPALAELLSIHEEELIQTADNIEKYYKENPQKKDDGSIRMTYAVQGSLKKIHIRIKNRILNRIRFADFLFAGIKGRGIKANAEYHCANGKPKVLVTIDLKNFYPSITPIHIKNIWLFFFKFSEEVSELLTKLTTFLGELPQGASTSSYLANLIFWEQETRHVRKLNSLNASYTRFADDISITLHKKYTQNELKNIILLTISFLKHYKFKINRKKFKISPDNTPMLLNKTVCLNNGYCSIDNKKRKKAKIMVYNYKKRYIGNSENIYSQKDRHKIIGFLNHCNMFRSHTDIHLQLNEMKNFNRIN